MKTTDKKSTSRRVPELDAIRGLAVIGVLLFHTDNARFYLGASGVDLFFVLSGYLITSIILKYESNRGFLVSFYMRRGLRIWPVYYLTLLTFVAVGLFWSRPFPSGALPYFLTFTQNVPLYWRAEGPWFYSQFIHTWSLAVEEQFYLIWPALIWLVGRRYLIPMSLAVIAIAVRSRFADYHPVLLLSRCDGLALGGLLAVLLSDQERVAYRLGTLRQAFGWLGLASLGYVLWLAARGAFVYGGLSLLAMNLFFFSAVGLVICHAEHPALGVLRDRRLCYIGLISYGIYLYHPIVFWLVSLLGLPFPWYAGLSLASCLAVAILSWEYLERPILTFKERFSYGTSPEPAPSGISEPDPVPAVEVSLPAIGD